MSAAQQLEVMITMVRALGILLMMLMPGGLVLLALFIVSRVIAEGMRREQGSSSHRFARAFASVRWPEIWREARAVIRPA